MQNDVYPALFSLPTPLLFLSKIKNGRKGKKLLPWLIMIHKIKYFDLKMAKC